MEEYTREDLESMEQEHGDALEEAARETRAGRGWCVWVVRYKYCGQVREYYTSPAKRMGVALEEYRRYAKARGIRHGLRRVTEVEVIVC